MRSARGSICCARSGLAVFASRNGEDADFGFVSSAIATPRAFGGVAIAIGAYRFVCASDVFLAMQNPRDENDEMETLQEAERLSCALD